MKPYIDNLARASGRSVGYSARKPGHSTATGSNVWLSYHAWTTVEAPFDVIDEWKPVEMIYDDGKVVDLEEMRKKFKRLAGQWRRETMHASSITELALHPAYQQIVGLGPAAVGMIIAELRREPDHWFWALNAITGEDPVPDDARGDLAAMTRAWLEWAERRPV